MSTTFKITILLVLITLFSLGAFLQGQTSKTAALAVKKKRFKAGEELTYAMTYGFIHGGNASIVLNFGENGNKKVYHARVTAKSVGLTDRLFKIEDIYESYFDMQTCLPYKSIRNISEGNYKDYNEVYFARNDCTIFSQKTGIHKVPPDILDMVSSLFYLRNMELDLLNKGDVIKFVTYFGDEVFPFPLRYKGKEIVKGKLGKLECYRFDPVVEVGRVFDSEDDMTLWVTADQNQLPYRVRMDMIVGAVYCDLTVYKNLVTELKKKE